LGAQEPLDANELISSEAHQQRDRSTISRENMAEIQPVIREFSSGEKDLFL
jgi:hypothetical protein